MGAESIVSKSDKCSLPIDPKLKETVLFRTLSVAAIAVLASGTAMAAPANCVAMHKDLNTMGKQLQSYVNQQTDLAAQITALDETRVAAEQDLSMVGMDASIDPADVLNEKITESRTSATEKRVELDALNTKLLTLNDKYNASVAEFNKSCVK